MGRLPSSGHEGRCGLVPTTSEKEMPPPRYSLCNSSGKEGLSWLSQCLGGWDSHYVSVNMLPMQSPQQPCKLGIISTILQMKKQPE